MRKWVLLPLSILLLLAAAVLLLMPYIVGVVVEKKYTTMLNEVSLNDDIKFNVVSYERRWFDADAVITVEMNPQKLFKLPESEVEQGSVSFKITQHIEHGPILPVTPNHEKAHEFLGLALLKSHIEPSIGEIDAMSMMALNGALITVINAPKLHYQSDALNVNVNIAGAGLTLFNMHHLQKMEGELHVDRFEFESGDVLQRIENLKTQFNLSRGEGDLLLGVREGTINYISWKLPDAEAKAELYGIKMFTSNALENNKLDTRTYLLISDLNLDEMRYGRQEIDLLVEDIDLSAFLLLRQELASIEENGVASFNDVNKYMNIMLLMLSKGVNVDLKTLHLSTPWGSPELQAKLYFGPRIEVATSIGETLENLAVDAHIKLPSVFLVKLMEATGQLASVASFQPLIIPPSKVREQIKAWVDNKWLVPIDKGFTIDVMYKDTFWYINNEPFDFEQFKSQTVQEDEMVEVELLDIPSDETNTEEGVSESESKPESETEAQPEAKEENNKPEDTDSVDQSTPAKPETGASGLQKLPPLEEMDKET